MEVAKTNLSDKARYDYELVQQAVNDSNQQAYAELMGRYRDSIYFMLLKMVNNKDDADDLTIEAFGKAFSRLHQYTPSYAFSTWLFKIASNNAIDFIRKQKKKMLSLDNEYKNEDGDKMRFDVESDGRNPAEEAMYKQRVEHMHAIVQKLKPRYRQLVELRYFKEYSYDEISKELDLPLGTVKAQLFRAREFLMNLMKDDRDKI
ncbi:MAG: sigma-70 family RNA polymerase sigma factor [Flavobacteriales bacterium]|nr:sigma-70 family RNA polymerase sigma factor [Flavobacteriales bacterium]